MGEKRRSMGLIKLQKTLRGIESIEFRLKLVR
jgi:hypothetical protein